MQRVIGTVTGPHRTVADAKSKMSSDPGPVSESSDDDFTSLGPSSRPRRRAPGPRRLCGPGVSDLGLDVPEPADVEVHLAGHDVADGDVDDVDVPGLDEGEPTDEEMLERDISEIPGVMFEEGGCGDRAEEIDREVERLLGLEHGSLDLADGGEHVDEAAASAAAAAAEAADDPADLDLGGAEPDAGAAAGDAPPADERADIAPDAAGLDLQALLDRHACSQTEILFPVPEWVITRGGEKIGSVSEVRKPNCDFTTYKATCLMSRTTVVGDKRRRCSCWLRTDRCDHRTAHYTLVEWLVSGHPGADGAADHAATCKAINERYPAPAKPRGRGGKRSAAG